MTLWTLIALSIILLAALVVLLDLMMDAAPTPPLQPESDYDHEYDLWLERQMDRDAHLADWHQVQQYYSTTARDDWRNPDPRRPWSDTCDHTNM